MNKKASPHSTSGLSYLFAALLAIAAVVGVFYFGLPELFSVSYVGEATTTSTFNPPSGPPPPPPLNLEAYNEKLLALAHVASSSPWYEAFMTGTTTPVEHGSSTGQAALHKPLWPVIRAVPQDARAILPAHRILAYYGNFYSKGMGILGEYDEDVVLEKLRGAVAHWEAADPTTPVVPAIEYIDVTAQAAGGKDGKYRARMPDSQIDKALAMAKKVDGIVILDIQVGFSTLQDELPLLADYWKMPEVHLAIDPEFSMKGKYPPGDEIGTFSSSDINYTINYLSDIVKENNLPPKVLVVHRFTEDMVTGYYNIKPTPQVQVVMVMDGWGFPAKKVNTYNSVIWPEPVQFTGIKLFYKNDLKQSPPRLMTDSEVLNLTPTPIYVQYQ